MNNPIFQFRKDIKAALPTFGLRNEREQERMSSVLMVAVEKDPQLVTADRQSLIASVRQCANHGLVPDGNEATLQVYNTKVKIDGAEKWIKKVQYQPMVRGIINRVQKSGKIRTFWADVVYKGETFTIDASDGERRPVHIKQSEFNRGTDDEIIGAYSVAKFKDGTVDCEPMDRSEIEKVRKVAKTQKVWEGWFTEKAKVAVLRRHSKRLPLSSEDLDMILNRGGDEHDLERDMRDVTPEREKPARTLAQRLQEPEEPMDGEVMPDQDGPHWTEEIDTSEAFPGDDVFTEGAEAFQSGADRTTCPYSDPSVACHWLGGWDQAKAAAEK
ncbi:ribosome modulation factor [Roseovarius amoyensis]|uniref:ribosome modulation factor n=1 Tax=Roseovarius amoyensis TaxID=2211448 RepID=UPI000DBE2D52|nr:Rmf/CrpP family protein [Roseovarius amoyensis]